MCRVSSPESLLLTWCMAKRSKNIYPQLFIYVKVNEARRWTSIYPISKKIHMYTYLLICIYFLSVFQIPRWSFHHHFYTCTCTRILQQNKFLHIFTTSSHHIFRNFFHDDDIDDNVIWYLKVYRGNIIIAEYVVYPFYFICTLSPSEYYYIAKK